MTLPELMSAVQEKNLSKAQLEEYRDDLSHLFAQTQLALADLEKMEARYFYERQSPEVTDVSIKRSWRATPEGQELIQRSREAKAIEKLLSSLKSRLYSIF